MKYLIVLLCLVLPCIAADSPNQWQWDVSREDIMDTLNAARDSIDVLLGSLDIARDSLGAALDDLDALQDSLNEVLTDILTTYGEVVVAGAHVSSNERWFGLAAVLDGENHVADQINSDITPFQIDAGNDTWGSWVQILGADDTPSQTGMTYFMLNKIWFYTLESNQDFYFMQIAFGVDVATALAAEDYTEFMYISYLPSTNYQGFGGINAKRYAAGTKVWARCCSPDNDTSTMDFYIGLHEYNE